MRAPANIRDASRQHRADAHDCSTARPNSVCRKGDHRAVKTAMVMLSVLLILASFVMAGDIIVVTKDGKYYIENRNDGSTISFKYTYSVLLGKDSGMEMTNEDHLAPHQHFQMGKVGYVTKPIAPANPCDSMGPRSLEY